MPEETRACPICELGPHETVLEQTPEFLVMNTKFMKGHKERFMVLMRNHTHPDDVGDDVKRRGIQLLYDVACKRIGLDAGFIILEDRYSSIPDHWHQVCMDLLRGEDYEQVVDTHRTIYTADAQDGRFLDAGEPHAPRDAA